MTITNVEFEKGLTYEAYKAQMSKNRERLEANECLVELGADDATFFRQIPQPIYILAFTEDWCEPALLAVPVLAHLAKVSHKLHPRYFLREQNPDLMNRFLKDGLHQTIPAFIFLTADFQELGRWYERPAAISHLIKELQRDTYNNDPAFVGVTPGTPFAQLPELARTRLMELLAESRIKNQPLSNQETVKEIRTLIEDGLRMTAGIEAQVAHVAAK